MGSYKYPEDTLTVFQTQGRKALIVFSGGGDNDMRPIRDRDGNVRVGFLTADGTEADMRTAEYGYAKPRGMRRIGRLDDAGKFSAWDRESSASRQHYIDAGRFLTHAEVAEFNGA